MSQFLIEILKDLQCLNSSSYIEFFLQKPCIVGLNVELRWVIGFYWEHRYFGTSYYHPAIDHDETLLITALLQFVDKYDPFVLCSEWQWTGRSHHWSSSRLQEWHLADWARCSLQCAVFTVKCAVFSVQCAFCSVQRSLCSVQCALDQPKAVGPELVQEWPRLQHAQDFIMFREIDRHCYFLTQIKNLFRLEEIIVYLM